MSFLHLRNLTKTFPDGTVAVRGIDLDVEPGMFVVLLGPSGCGKTTTLRMVAGLEAASAGSITLDGIDVTLRRPSQRDVGFVFQFYALYPHLRVEQNIAFPLQSVGTQRREIRRRVAEVAERLKITPLLKRHPRELSGGDQQRVALARAMVRQPKLWLMDEPLGTLDADVRADMREFVRERQLEQKVTTIYVTHDQEEAMSLADVVVIMNDGEILQSASPAAVYDTPADRFVATFVGSPGMNFLEGRIDGSLFALKNGATLPLGNTYPSGDAILGARPEALRFAKAAALKGTVALSEYMGSHSLVYVDLIEQSGRVCVRVENSFEGAPNESISLAIDPASINLFDRQTGKRIDSQQRR